MGQYFLAVNLDRLEFLDPAWLGDALKLRALAHGLNTPVTLVALLTTSGGRGSGDFNVDDPDGVQGRWAGDRVAIVGDYAEDGDLPNAPIPASEIYASCREGRDFINISELVAAWLERVLQGRFVGVPATRGVPGTRCFVRPGQTVTRRNQGELETGRVVEVTAHKIVVDWPTGRSTCDVYSPDFLI